jgi:hypothetical protein
MLVLPIALTLSFSNLILHEYPSIHYAQTGGKMRSVKNVIYGILAIIIGIVLFGAGINMMLHPGEVTCGGQTMSQGDICRQTRNGVQTGTRDYTQQKQNNQTTSIVMIVFGPLMAIGGFFMLRSGRRRRVQVSPVQNAAFNQANTPYQPGAYPPPQPGAYPPPGYPQQPGAYPPPIYPQQSGAYPPPQPGAYPPPGYPQQPGNSQQPPYPYQPK